MRPQPTDIVLVAGGSDAATDAAAEDPALLGWLARAARTVGRIGSVCDGAFILASAGHPRRAAGSDALVVVRAAGATASQGQGGPRSDLRPRRARLDRRRHQHRNRHVAGDGRGRSRPEARRHGRRAPGPLRPPPGFQSQFSEELVAQTLASDPLAPVISWLRANLRARARRGNSGAQGRNVGPHAASELLAGARPQPGQARSRSSASSMRGRSWQRRDSARRSSRRSAGSARRRA